jgi:Flp pilus assembly pilin Flp
MLDSLNRLWIRAFTALSSVKREEGQTMTEYAVVLTLIAVALVTALTGLRTAIVNVITSATNAI